MKYTQINDVKTLLQDEYNKAHCKVEATYNTYQTQIKQNLNELSLNCNEQYNTKIDHYEIGDRIGYGIGYGIGYRKL